MNDLEEKRAKETGTPLRVIDHRTLSRNLRQLLGGDDEIKEIKGDSSGHYLKEKDTYCIGFLKKNESITGYWYEKKVIEDVPGEFPRFLTDAVIYSKVLTPEFKPQYYDNLQDIFGTGQVKNMTDFMNAIVEYMPYSEKEDGGINVMKNVLDIQQAIDKKKKIKFKLAAYRYREKEVQLLPIGDQERCVSPFQIMMSNGRYYLMAKNRKIKKGFLFYRVDLMDEIEILNNQKSDDVEQDEWGNPQKFLIANPFFYAGEVKEDVIIGFEEEQLTQIIDWFGAEENGLYEIQGTYNMQKNANCERIVKMVKIKFTKVNINAFSFWIMQYIDCLEILEGDKVKRIVKERMEEALKRRIR